MDIRVFKNEEEIGKAVGELYCDFINSKPDCVLGFATGATPVPTYKYLVEQYKAGKVSRRCIIPRVEHTGNLKC